VRCSGGQTWCGAVALLVGFPLAMAVTTLITIVLGD
jgi:hypothetical protein